MPRSWEQLSDVERADVVRLYYGRGARRLPGWVLVRRFDLAVLPWAFPEFFPGAPSQARCARCKQPLELLALSTSEAASIDTPSVSWRPLGAVQLPFRRGRTRPCQACGHRTHGRRRCPCSACTAEDEGASA